MGPYNEDRQYRRACALGTAILEEGIDPQFRRIYEEKLRQLSRNEQDYNERVVAVYKDLPLGITCIGG